LLHTVHGFSLFQKRFGLSSALLDSAFVRLLTFGIALLVPVSLLFFSGVLRKLPYDVYQSPYALQYAAFGDKIKNLLF
jgi:hypothetical protein